MTLDFHEPPAAKKAGGLDLAVRCLRDHLLGRGLNVRTNPTHATDFAPPDVIHFHGLWQPRFLKISKICRRNGTPYVVSPHGMLEPWAWNHKRWKKWPYFLLFERRHLHGAAAILATSDLEAANLKRFFPKVPCPVIPLGLPDRHGSDYVAARQRLGWQPEEHVLLFLSRIHPKKGLHILLNSLAAFCSQSLTATGHSSLFDKTRLVIIGGGNADYIKQLQALVTAQKAQLPKIEWLGEIWGEGKWSYLQGADLFCLPSFSENFGLAVLEALQVGTRVLTTNTCPWRFLTDWNAGFVVEPNAKAVLHGLEAFWNSRQWTEAQRRHLAERIHENFGWETIGPRYEQLYGSVLATSAPEGSNAFHSVALSGQFPKALGGAQTGFKS